MKNYVFQMNALCQTTQTTQLSSGLTFEFQIVSQETIQTQNLALIIDTSSVQTVDLNNGNTSVTENLNQSTSFVNEGNQTNQTNTSSPTTDQNAPLQSKNISMLLQYYLDLLPPIILPPPELVNATSNDVSVLFTTHDVVDPNLCPLDHICGENATEPESCPLNTITLSTGTSDSCEIAPRTEICESGFHYDRFAQNCTQDCGPGYYGNVFTLGFCMGCPMGTFSTVNFATHCLNCQNGKYSDLIGATDCFHCPFGKSTSEYSGYINCVQACTASPGYYCPITTQSAVQCPPGYFCTGAPTTDGYHNQKCPVNTYNPNPGADSLDDCIQCPLYEVATVTGSTQCSVCAPGTYYQASNPTGPSYAGSCESCQPGTSSVQNATVCSTCFPGSYATTGSTCKQCRPGFYSDEIGLSQCKECPEDTYTFNSTLISGVSTYNVLWGSITYSQCKPLPSNSGQNLVCIAGRYIKNGICAECPKGYYCPTITTMQTKSEGLRVCPDGTYSPVTNAISSSECSEQSRTPALTLSQCSITKDDSSLGGLRVTSLTSSKSRNVAYFTTNTAVYRMFLHQSSFPNTFELIAGNESTSGAAMYTTWGSDARFSSLTAIAVEFDNQESSIAVVGDGQTVRLIDIYSRKVQLLGNSPVPVVSKVGGIAIRTDAIKGHRLAYVSDTSANRILVFNLETYTYTIVAGSYSGSAGYREAANTNALFRQPKGLAFAQRDSSSVILLVADSGNNRIRQIDLSSTSSPVTTWFVPIDETNPEISNPVSITVVPGNSGIFSHIYYISQGNQKVKIIQYPDQADSTLKTVSTLNIVSQTENIHSIFPFGDVFTQSSAVGYAQFLIFQENNMSIRTLVQTSITQTTEGGSTNPNGCHLRCTELSCGNLTRQTVCGNSFLDKDEECDNGNKQGGGCSPACRFKPGYTCPVPSQVCSDPCPAYSYNCITSCPGNVYHNKSFCKEDCKVLEWRPGFKINEFCVESDIDECAEELNTKNNCPSTATCRNTDGSYECSCLNSYFGDGNTCNDIAYAVYTVFDIPSYTREQLDLNSNPLLKDAKNDIYNKLKQAFAQTLFNNLPIANQTSVLFQNSNKSLYTLTRMYTFISLDPNTNGSARLEISSLFESSALAELVSRHTSISQIDTALSQAIFGQNDGVKTIQSLKTRTHDALSFSSVNVIDGWGMNISSVVYNRSCAVEGVQPRGGCWEIEMIYMGGPSMPKSHLEAIPVIQQSKNLLYFPRIDKDPENFNLLQSMQALTMSSSNFFGCGTSDGSDGIPFSATACCLRSVNASYRPNTKFSDFLNTNLYNENVPKDVCDSGNFNTTWPNAEILSLDPENTNDGSTNDLVVGKIDGMPHSEVRLLETLDYTTRTYKVLIVLEEGDLRQSASLIQGTVGLNYNLTFFVGLANFKPMGGSILSTRNMQQKITVSKSNILTLSTYGANQDPLISSIDLKLRRIKVTDFFNPVRYLYYIQPTLTLPPQFTAPEDGNIIPLNGIRVIKTLGSVTGSDPNWKQACYNRDNTFFYHNQSLKDLVSMAQAQECVMTDLQMCQPPSSGARNIIQFGIPLPEDFISNADFRDVNPYMLSIQLLVVAKQTNPAELVRTTINMGIRMTPYSLIQECEEMQASQNMSDIIQGNIYIGVAQNSIEWKNNVLKKLNIDQPGTRFSDSFQFDTTTVQGSVMTFAALGTKAYFDDVRNQGQYVKINDLHTVHFLEPIGGKGGASPKFTEVLSKLQEGAAFRAITDHGNKSTWLEPTEALLTLCPKKQIAGKLTCRTRTDSTFKNNVLVRDSKEVIEVVPNSSSVNQMKTMMAYIMQQGASTDYTDDLGENFHNQLVSQLTLNDRYRKAYVINPVIEWSTQAISESKQVATSFTVCTKIVAVGLVTIYSATGAPIARRLLSMDYSTEFQLPPLPAESLRRNHRHLLQTDQDSSTIVQLSKTQLPNSLQLNLNIPGYDEISQLCSIYNNVPFGRCAVFEIVVQIPKSRSESLCNAYREGSLTTVMEDSIYNLFVVKNPHYSISDLNLLNFHLENCDVGLPSSNSRNLLQLNNKFPNNYDYVLSYHHVAFSANPGQSINFDSTALSQLSQYLNSDILHNMLGGGASVVYVNADFKPGNNNTIINIDIYVKNGTKPNQTIINTNKGQLPNWNPGADDMFIADYTSIPKSGSSSLTRHDSKFFPLLGFAFNFLLFITSLSFFWDEI